MLADVKVAGGRLYLTLGVGTDYTLVRVFDLSDPVVLTPLESELPMDVMKITTYSPDLAIKDDKVYIPTGYKGLHMIDVSNPSRPIQTGPAPVLTPTLLTAPPEN